MTDYVIPCETIARLSHLLSEDDDDLFFRTFRIDNGVIVATDRRLMAVERIGGPDGVIHLLNDPALIEVCRKEALYKSDLTITVVEALKFATAKTTYGYVHPGNCCLWSDEPSKLHEWRSRVADAVTETGEYAGGMAWNADQMAALANAAPSRLVVFPEAINVARPIIIRDVHDADWFGMFGGWLVDHPSTPATLPPWFVA